jgi:hypothetical protein
MQEVTELTLQAQRYEKSSLLRKWEAQERQKAKKDRNSTQQM